MALCYTNEIEFQHSDSIVPTIDSRCFGISQESRRKKEVYDLAGNIIGQISIMPPVYIQDKISQMRQSACLTLEQRYERLKNASQIYEKETLAGLSPEAYITLVYKVSGIPKITIAKSLTNISHGLYHMSEILEAATPKGAVWDSKNIAVGEGCSLFSRRGEVVTIIAAGNGPGVHGLWPQAIAMGYRTLIKPSSREPFTAQRLIYALELAGLADYAALIPTDHKGSEILIEQSDLAIVYGGSNIATKYQNNPHVLVQGPGRSKIIVGKDVSHEEAIKVAVQSILSLGGAACVCTSAILVEDNHKEFAKKLRLELELAYQEESFKLANQQQADAYKKLLQSDDIPWTYDAAFSQVCSLRPHVNLVENASDPKIQRELPFPCVTIAPFKRQEAYYRAISGSLVVTILSKEHDIISKILVDASIANVYIGKIPTTWMDFKVPHDGYLADFLMCNRGIKIENQWLQHFQSCLNL